MFLKVTFSYQCLKRVVIVIYCETMCDCLDCIAISYNSENMQLGQVICEMITKIPAVLKFLHLCFSFSVPHRRPRNAPLVCGTTLS